MNLENTFLNEVTKTQKNIHGRYVLTCTWILAIKYRIPTLHSTDPKKLNNKKRPRESFSEGKIKYVLLISKVDRGRKLGRKGDVEENKVLCGGSYIGRAEEKKGNLAGWGESLRHARDLGWGRLQGDNGGDSS